MKNAITLTFGASLALVVAASAQVPPALTPVQGMIGPSGSPATTTAPVAQIKTTAVTISPMAPKRPVLRYGLITRVEDRLRGNAALFFGAAAAEVARIRTMDKYQELDDKLREKPIADLTAEDMAKVRENFELPMYWLSHGARRSHAEWPVEITEGMSALLPSLSSYRSIANRLSLEIRWDLHEKRHADAVEKIRVGLTMGRFLADGDTLIEMLVGTSICEIMAQRLLDLAQQLDAPNLYWSLVQLPDPLIRPPYNNERGWIYFSLPELKKVRENTFSDGDWLSLMTRLGDPKGLIGSIQGVDPDGRGGPPAWAGQLAVLALALRAHPRAQEFFREQGLTQAQIDEMGPRKLIARYFAESFEVWMDEAAKRGGLKYFEAAGLGDLDRAVSTNPDYGVNPFLLVIPSLSRVHFSTARVDRSFAAVRTVEALRMYAAEHGGAFPAKLEDCPVPVPIDPLTGKPFVYSVSGGKAVLEGKAERPRDSVRLEITIRK